MIELVGTSEKSVEEAVQAGIARVQKTIRNLRWFESPGRAGISWTARSLSSRTLKVGFTMEEPQ